MLKILQAKLQQYVNRELPDVQAGFRKGRGTRDQIANNRWIMEKAREFQKNIYFYFIDYAKDFDWVDHNKLWAWLRTFIHYRGLECKSRKLRSTWVTGKFGLGMKNEAGQRLVEFCQENALIIANTLFHQHKRRLYTWTSPDGQHRNQIDYILCSQTWRSSMQALKPMNRM